MRPPSVTATPNVPRSFAAVAGSASWSIAMFAAAAACPASGSTLLASPTARSASSKDAPARLAPRATPKRSG
jgi:hypothetical protein